MGGRRRIVRLRDRPTDHEVGGPVCHRLFGSCHPRLVVGGGYCFRISCVDRNTVGNNKATRLAMALLATPALAR